MHRDIARVIVGARVGQYDDAGARVRVEHHRGAIPFLAAAMADDLPLADLVSATVRHMDGRNDDWFNVPAETRHL